MFIELREVGSTYNITSDTQFPITFVNKDFQKESYRRVINNVTHHVLNDLIKHENLPSV